MRFQYTLTKSAPHDFCQKSALNPLNLDSAIEREKGVLDIGVNRKSENFVVTLLVMKIFSYFLGTSRACAYFRDSTA